MQRIFTLKSEFVSKLLAGLCAGALSSGLCNPTDLIKVRMQASKNLLNDSNEKAVVKFNLSDNFCCWFCDCLHLNVSNRQDNFFSKGDFHYTSVFDAFKKIIKNEGIAALYTGVYPTMARASVLAAAEMAIYDTLKTFFTKNNIFQEGSGMLFIVCALLASMCSSFVSNPFDMARSRLMNQPRNKEGNGLIYKNLIDCFVKCVRTEGIFVLWAGYWAFFIRLGPNTIIGFYVMEHLRRILPA